MALEIYSPAFDSGGDIPSKYTCDGENVSPPLAWRGVPSGAKSLVLICDDPDAGAVDPFTHWILYGIPPRVQDLPESSNAQSSDLPWEGMAGRNSFSHMRYDGPCPPFGESHRYFFRLFALDEDLGLAAGMNRDQILHRIEDHVLERAEMIGRYTRS